MHNPNITQDKMKRILKQTGTTLLATSILMSGVVPSIGKIELGSINAEAATTEMTEVIDGVTYTYNVSSGYVILTHIEANTGANITIPKEIQGIPVEYLSGYLLQTTDRDKDKTVRNFKNLTIPNTVKTISSSSFYNTTFENIKFEKNTTNNFGGRWVFDKVTVSDTLELPDGDLARVGITGSTINKLTNSWGSSLQSSTVNTVEFRDGITDINLGGNKIKDLVTPKSVKTIYLRGANITGNLTLSEGLEEIADTGLMDVTLNQSYLKLPSTLKKFGSQGLQKIKNVNPTSPIVKTYDKDGKFAGDIRELVIDVSAMGYTDSTNTSVDRPTFLNSQVTEVILPKTMTEIPDFFFSGTQINKVDLSHIKKIGKLSFSGVYNIRKIDIPKTVTEVGESAFSIGTGMSIYFYNKNIILPSTALVFPSNTGAVYGYRSSQVETNYASKFLELSVPKIETTMVEGAKYSQFIPQFTITNSDNSVDITDVKYTIDGESYDGTTPYTKGGNHVLKVTATNAIGATSSALYTFKINSAPTIIKQIATQNAEVGTRLELDLTEYFQDAEGDPLTYVAETNDIRDSEVWIVGNKLRFNATAAGEFEIKVHAKDASGESEEITFNIIAEESSNGEKPEQPKPDNPLEVTGAMTDLELIGLDSKRDINLEGMFNIPNDTEGLEYVVTSSDGAVVEASMDGTTLKLNGKTYGDSNVKVYVQDAKGNKSGNLLFLVSVQEKPSWGTVGSISDTVIKAGEQEYRVDLTKVFGDIVDKEKEVTYKVDVTDAKGIVQPSVQLSPLLKRSVLSKQSLILAALPDPDDVTVQILKETEYVKVSLINGKKLVVEGLKAGDSNVSVKALLKNGTESDPIVFKVAVKGDSSGGGTTTPPTDGGNGGGTTTPPTGGGNDGGTTTPPTSGGNGGGTTTPPTGGGSGGGTTTPPTGGGNNGGTTTPPTGGGNNGGTTTPPTDGDNGGGTTTPPTGGGNGGGTTTPPTGGGNVGSGDTNTGHDKLEDGTVSDNKNENYNNSSNTNKESNGGTISNNKNEELKTLPQTGSANSTLMTATGIVAILMAILTFGYYRRKTVIADVNDDK
ncbi:leucine-rich repeat protein [Viridibacillus arvi]|uniref:leucine-rich repeat protein n=1 Tax=Viridibacillus arvi TaxID=263475 RepID=UPI0034CE3C1A